MWLSVCTFAVSNAYCISHTCACMSSTRHRHYSRWILSARCVTNVVLRTLTTTDCAEFFHEGVGGESCGRWWTRPRERRSLKSPKPGSRFYVTCRCRKTLRTREIFLMKGFYFIENMKKVSAKFACGHIITNWAQGRLHLIKCVSRFKQPHKMTVNNMKFIINLIYY
jgi:hypothetical protein